MSEIRETEQKYVIFSFSLKSYVNVKCCNFCNFTAIKEEDPEIVIVLQ